MDSRTFRTDLIAAPLLVLASLTCRPGIAAQSDETPRHAKPSITVEDAAAEVAAKDRIERLLDLNESLSLLDALELDSVQKASQEAEAWRDALDTDRTVEFAIDDGPLPNAVRQVSMQGWRGTYYFDQTHGPSLEEAEAIRVKGFRGTFTVREAIDRVLSGTGLAATFYRSTIGIRVYRPEGMPKDGVERPVSLSFLGGRLDEEAEYLFQRTATRFPTGKCGRVHSNPLRGKFRALEAWTELIRPICMPQSYSLREYIENNELLWYSALVNAAGRREVDFNIEAKERKFAIRDLARQAGLEIPYLSNSDQEEEEMVGPILGRMSIHRAIYHAAKGTLLYPRWMDSTTVALEPLPFYPTETCNDENVCSLIWTAPQTGEIQVTASRIPTPDERASIQEHVNGAKTVVIDRARIDELGVSSIPEALQYLTQTAFTRSSGYRLTGAQYAEGRGIGPATVLIENKRTVASASSLEDSAFDLNTIPLAAVERIEFVPDSGSVVYGMDGLGGIVNIVLRRPEKGLTAETRYGTARGGSIERRFTTLARAPSETEAILIADYFELTNLLGNSRSRYLNQDYRRYEGGVDQRSLSSAPGNVRLQAPGAPILGLPAVNDGGAVDADDLLATANLTSLLQYQSVSPARRVISLIGSVDTTLGSVALSSNAIYTHQETEYTLSPPTVSGLPIAADHPNNHLGAPLEYYGLLTGIPAQQFEGSSNLIRADMTFNTNLFGWNTKLSLVHTRERFTTTVTNQIDEISLASSLDTNNAGTALRFASPNPGAGRGDLLAPPLRQLFTANASQAHLLAEQALAFLPAGDLKLQLGAEWRREDIEFDEVERGADRDSTGSFVSMRVPVVKTLELIAGLRHDNYTGEGSVTSNQYGFAWNPNARFTFRGDVGERYRPPSLYELHLKRQSIDSPVLDPKTDQTTVASIVVSGRRDLQATTAKAKDLGFTFRTPAQLELSVDYWQVSVANRIDSLPLFETLANEDYLPGRITRGPGDGAGPGRILSIDLGWQNLGEIHASGVDVTAQKAIELGTGRLRARLGLTWNEKYRYRDLPKEIATLTDRVDIAAERGTIPQYRASTQITWEDSRWRLTANVLHRPSYRDAFAGIQNGYYVASQTTLDLNIARRWTGTSLTVGATNIFDSEPDFSTVSAWGYDTSQGDLRGRFVFAELKRGF